MHRTRNSLAKENIAGLTYDPNLSEKHNQIIEAAVKLFNSKGYESTSIRDIAASIKLTQGTIYHYVKSKEQLLYEINDRLISCALKNKNRILEAPSSAKDKICQVMKDILTIVEIHADYIGVLIKDYTRLSKRNLSTIIRKRDEYEEMVKTIIQEGIDNKELRNLDVQISAMALFGICNWATTWYRPHGRLSIDEIAQILSTIYLEGMAPKDK